MSDNIDDGMLQNKNFIKTNVCFEDDVYLPILDKLKSEIKSLCSKIDDKNDIEKASDRLIRLINSNEELENAPELVNEDPYGKGWMIKIKMSNPSQIDDLLTTNAYREVTGV